jgi:succinate dehydrogenase/fumarate reductase flavoprotein subunit
MDKSRVVINGMEMDVFSLNTVIVGSGAAGLNAADTLYSLGVHDIGIVTEGFNMGTSRNTGSDKQTYYKLTVSGDTPDSVREMAETLFNGGSMHGDIALIEAALSAKSFFKLVDIGVPFPHNKYGEYIGYKTDHDPRNRATSAGPLTSKFMTEKLETQVRAKNIRIFDGFLVVAILTVPDSGGKKAVGLLAVDVSRTGDGNMGFKLFNCTNIIYATGGPAGMYLTSVYPESQTGASGIAFEAGARGINLTESQYGIASIKFRWNLSGTYQQVIPRYVSTDKNGGDEREFLEEYFPEPGKMLDAIFLKGYQWPFDPRKVANYGSSLIDILVYNEIQNKGRRVFLDFMRNPSWGSVNGELDFSLLGDESRKYLENSGALFGKPIDRLEKMNRPAIDLYLNNGIDLTREYLEIAVCAQHNNGGLVGNTWWESNLKHFFPVGEVNGTFGVYRPGGSALNSTQTGSFRASQYIAANYAYEPLGIKDFIGAVEKKVSDIASFAGNVVSSGSAISSGNDRGSNLKELLTRAKERMSKYGAQIRTKAGCDIAIRDCLADLKDFSKNIRIGSPAEIPDMFRYRDILISQFVYLRAIREYIEKGGKSRGSYLVGDESGIIPAEGLPDDLRFSLDDGKMSQYACEIELDMSDGEPACKVYWSNVRPIPEEDNWFENVWNAYRNNLIIK